MVSQSEGPSIEQRAQGLFEQFTLLIWFAFRNLTQKLQKYGLTHPQFITLASLVQHGQPANMRQLATVALQDAPTLTGIVNRLVKMGMVRRTRSGDDRRVVLVEATPQGVELIQSIRHNFRTERSFGFAEFTSEEQLRKLELFLDHVLNIQVEVNENFPVKDVAVAKEWLEEFAEDPLEFIKTHELTFK